MNKEEVNYKEFAACCLNCDYCEYEWPDDLDGECRLLNDNISLRAVCDKYKND